MPHLLQANARQHDAEDHERCGEVDGDQAGLGFETAGAFRIPRPRRVVDPMTSNLAEDGGHERREIEEAQIPWGEVVELGVGEEDRDLSVEADDPGEGEDVIAEAEEDGELDDGKEGAHECSGEGDALLAGLPLLDTDNSHEARFAGGLVHGGDGAVVVGFVHEAEDEEPADGRQHGDEVECPAPGVFPGDEGGDEGA